jgi:hypothetical protein
MAFWCQRAKIKFTIESDENTKYLHALASSHYRKNKIVILEINGSEFTFHDHKMEILTSYYKQLLGHTFQPTWNFSLSDLYPNHIPGLNSLTQPVTKTEVVQSFFQMNTNASLDLMVLAEGSTENSGHF